MFLKGTYQKITANVVIEACITLKNNRHGRATSKIGRKQKTLRVSLQKFTSSPDDKVFCCFEN
jgi:hypothetical protein